MTVPCSEHAARHATSTFRAEHSGARLVVADRERAARARADGRADSTSSIVEDVAAELRELAAASSPTHDTASDDIAFILYTSGHDEGSEGRRRTPTPTPGPSACRPSTGSTPARATSSGARRAPAGRSRSGTSCSARGRAGPRSSSTTAASTPSSASSSSQRLGVTVLCQAPTEYRLMAKLPTIGAVRPQPAPARRVGGRAARPRGDQGVPRRVRPHGATTATGRPRTRCSSRTRAAREIKPGSMGLPTPGHDVAVIDEEGNEQPAGHRGRHRAARQAAVAVHSATGTRPRRRAPCSAASGT